MPGIKWISPRGFLGVAVGLALLFGVCHGVGLRNDLSVIALTVPEGRSFGVALTGAICYLVAYFGVTLVAPVFLLAAVILWVLTRITRAAGPGGSP